MASGPIPDKLKIKKRLNFFISKRIFKLTKVNFKGSIKMYETSDILTVVKSKWDLKYMGYVYFMGYE